MDNVKEQENRENSGKDIIAESLKGDNHCVHVNDKGEKCNAYHGKKSFFCFLHDPEKISERSLAISQGGKSRAFLCNVSRVKIKKPKDVTKVVIKTLNEIRKGLIDPSTANSFFYGCGILLKSFETLEMEERLKELEEDARR